MGSFKSFGKRGFGGGKREFKANGGAFMYQATCADCSKQCEVPFKPTGERPVYCKECFAARRNGGGKPDGKHFDKPRFQNDKPRFENRPSAAGNAGISSTQFAELSGKLDRIINALAKFESVSAAAPALGSVVKETKAKTVKAKPAKKAPAKKKTKSK